jgi:hypothetical protein
MSTQDSPIEDGHNDASDEARLAGLVQQVRADYLLGTTTDAELMLRTRLRDAGIELDDAHFDKLVAEVTN